MKPEEKIKEMETFLKENSEETMDTRDMSNQLCGYKQALKDLK